MDIDLNAPVITRDEIVINAPLKNVWKILTDIPTWPKWNKDITNTMLPAPLAPAAVFHWTTNGMDIASTVGELIPEQRIVWSGLVQGILGIHLWTFETVDHGTRVRTQESWSGEPVQQQADFLQKALDQSIRSWLESLKRVAESPASA